MEQAIGAEYVMRKIFLSGSTYTTNCYRRKKKPRFDLSGSLYQCLLVFALRAFTLPTNAFSKKAENRAQVVALRMMFCNFGRIHKTLRVAPAIQADIAAHVRSLEEIAALAGLRSTGGR